MLELNENVKLVKKERNAAVKQEIKETLEKMPVGMSFEIAGKVKKATVKRIAEHISVKVEFGKDEAGKLWCKKI